MPILPVPVPYLITIIGEANTFFLSGDGQRRNQGRNFREATKAMAVVAPQFGLVPLKEIARLEVTVALMPQLTEPLSPLSLSCQYEDSRHQCLSCHVDSSVFC